MQQNYNKKRKLNKLKTSLLLLMMVCFAGVATAQTNVYMHSGTQNVPTTGYLNFYDSGGAASLDGDFFWENQYSPNENSTLTFKNGSNPIQVSFKTFQGWSDSGWPDYILRDLGDDWSARLNNDFLYIYDGETADEDKLLVTLTSNIKNEFTITANGPITFKFVSDGQYNGEGWYAEVRSVTNSEINKPIVGKDECGDYVNIFNPNLGGTVYYTTTGNVPVVSDPLQGTQLYNGPIEIDLNDEDASVTVMAIVYYGVGEQSAVTTLTLTHDDQRPAPGKPIVTVNGNSITMKPAVNPGLDETYNVIYTTDGTLPSANNYTAEITAPWNPIEWHTPNTTFIVATIAKKANCGSLVSDTVKVVFGNVVVPTPEISFPEGNATIECSMDGAAIYYTTDGSDPVFTIDESTHVVTVTNGTPYTNPFAVTMGTTVKAKAIFMNGSNVLVTGYEPSQIASKIYVPESGSGTDGSVVLLDDREDHSWSYYSDNTNPIHSLKPADVKITYKGYGPNTMTSTSTANMPANNAFDTEVTSSQVAVNVGETENQFIYLKTLENANEAGTGNYPYTMIANPFQVRPAATAGSVTPTVTRYVRTTTITAGRKYLIVSQSNTGSAYALGHNGNNVAVDAVTISSGSPANYIDVSYVDATSVWTANSGYTFQNGNYYIRHNNNNLSISTSTNSTSWEWESNNNRLHYDPGILSAERYLRFNNNTFEISTATSSVYLYEETTTGGEVTGDFRGFYAWRVKSLSNGLSIKVGNTTYTSDNIDNGIIIYPEQEIEFVTTKEEGNEVEFEALWARAWVNSTSSSERATNSGNYQNAYERNFKVVTALTTYDYPVTITTINPDGTGTAGSLSVGANGYTCSNDVKFENITFTNGGSRTFTSAGNDLIFGRGISGTIQTLQGISGDSGNLNYVIRVEQGAFTNFAMMRNSTATVTGVNTVKAILGSDYDRAKNVNNKLSITGTMYGGNGNHAFSSDTNRNSLTYDWYVKSGTFQGNVGTATAEQSIYMGTSGTSGNENSVQYQGRRRLTLEGGSVANIAGGINCYGNNYANYGVNDGSWTVMIRMKGGTVRGSIYGAAQFAGSSGDRRFVFTGGNVAGWIAGGCNGTNTTGGELYGDTYIYFGGKAKCDSNGSSTTIGPGQATGGNIFGAGSGNSGATGDNATVGRVNNSTIVIADEATIERNVYGGGNYGYVRNGENNKSDIHVLGGMVKGSVFGGANMQKGQNVNITMKDGIVEGNLYGGSNTQGTINYLATINMSGGVAANVFGGGYGSSTNMAADTKVTVSGGIVGTKDTSKADTYTYGNVYGGGYAGTVTGNTEVNISGGTMNNVYGAGLGTKYTGTTWPPTAGNANITGTTTVNVSGGTIANVYGGGENGSVAYNETATSATGKSTVSISGGNISENVFGGGENGTTQGTTFVNVSGGNIRGNVFGGALGAHGRIYVTGMRTVNMTGGHVYGNVYGGSRNANDGNSLARTDASFSAYTGDEKISVTNISGGIIDQHVYAAGYYGSTFGSVYAFIGKDAIENAPFKEPTTGITYSVTTLNIAGTVWAGGDWGTFNGEFGSPTVSGNSNIYVDGNGYETETSQTSNAQYMNIGGSLLGCGTSCHAGKKDRTIVVRNYGKANGEQPEKATRTFFSIQFAKTLIFDNANINFTGQGRINSLITTEKFGIYEIANGAVSASAPYGIRLINGSGLFLNAPVTQIANFKSMQLKSSYDDLYAALNDGGMVDGADFDTVTPANLPTVKNKVRVNHGIYVEVKYGSEFGPLIGYAYMMASNVSEDDATCAYARPRWESNAAFEQGDTRYNNPNDGGWVNYDSEENTFALDGTNPTSSGVQMPYENHTTRNGEDYFRIWRVGGKEHYREGVFDAAANGTATFSTTDVTITLPAFRAKTNYYRFETVGDGTNTSIDYGPDVLTFNAANYASPCANGSWMYYNEDNNQQVTGLNENSDSTAFKKALGDIKAQPDINFGLVIMPGEGLEGSNYIICSDADNNLANSNTRYTNDADTLQPKVNFRLTYYNKLSANMTWDPMTIVLVQCDASGKTVDRVTISLAVNTSASIEQEFTTQVYAIMDEKNGTAATYNAKVVLPTFNLHTSGEAAKFTLDSVNFEPMNSGNLIERGGSYNYTDFAVDYKAADNYDNTNGWDSNTGKHDTYPMAQPNPTPQRIGTAGGRSAFAIDFTLHYNSMIPDVTQTDTLGVLTYNITFDNYRGPQATNAQGQPLYYDANGNQTTTPTSNPVYVQVNNQPLTIVVYVIRRGQGTQFYLDGVNGSNSNTAKYPNDAAKALSTIFNRCGFLPGDVVYVVNKVTANNGLTWNGSEFNNVTLYRYNGGHELKNGVGPIVDNDDNDPYLGELLVANNKVSVTGITMDGYYNPGKGETPETSVQATSPLITINNGGSVELTAGTVLNKNYNSGNGGAVMVNDGGTLMMNKDAQIKDNVAAEGAGVYMAGTMIVSDTIKVINNKKGTAQDNVFLMGDEKVITIGTPAATDEYGALSAQAKIGVTKAMSTSDTYTKVVYVDTDLDWLETPFNSTPNSIIYHDGNKYQLVKYTSPNYLYWVGTWVTLQDWNPTYESATAEGYDPNNFDPSAIDTPEELAWFISHVNGLNGADPHPTAVATVTGDFDMSASIWVPIGSVTVPFEGTFEGNGHVITGLRSSLVQTNMGMFGSLAGNAEVKDVVANVNFNTNAGNMGSLVGTMNGGTLSNVEAAGTLTGGVNTVNMGGLVGLVDGGTIHSSFAVCTMTGTSNTVMGGLVGTNYNDLYNSYANTIMSGSTKMGGLVGVNSGTVENCYVALGTQDMPAFAYQNQITVGEEDPQTIQGHINYCYASKAGTQVGDSQTPGVVTKCGIFSAVMDRKAIGYMYGDNIVTATGNEYANHEDFEYLDNHTLVWNGLLSVLNQWVDNTEVEGDFSSWYRPTTQGINGDLPILAFPKDNCVGNFAEEDGKMLRYSASDKITTTNNVSAQAHNGLDALLANYSGKAANIFLYNSAINVTNGSGNANLFINEDAVLLQSGSNDINATVGVTFDNSYKQAKDFFDNVLLYDWHFFSSPLTAAPMGITYNTQANMAYGQPANITDMTGNYMPDNPTCSWDLYSFFEPEYHWINLKRSEGNHWHFDAPHGAIDYHQETTFTPGKGYMMAISQDSYLSNTGTLNTSDFTFPVTFQSQAPGLDEKGYNLLGNPYQAYLDMTSFLGANSFGSSYWVYLAEQNNYVAGNGAASENDAIPSGTLHPHQAFFVKASADGNATFNYSMATADAQDYSYYRGNKVNYPLVNLFATNADGLKDLAVVEFNRPDKGGSEKLYALNNANFNLSAAQDGSEYSILFTKEGTERVPVHFSTSQDGTFDMTWETMHGNFTSLLLVDNKTGVITDMLRSDHYTFDASTDDYASRFYITYACTGVDENETVNGGFAFFDGSEWVVNGQGNLDVIDVMGRSVYAKRLTNEQNRVNLNGVAAGVYLMRVNDGKNTMVQKIVVR